MNIHILMLIYRVLSVSPSKPMNIDPSLFLVKYEREGERMVIDWLNPSPSTPKYHVKLLLCLHDIPRCVASITSLVKNPADQTTAVTERREVSVVGVPRHHPGFRATAS